MNAGMIAGVLVTLGFIVFAFLLISRRKNK